MVSRTDGKTRRGRWKKVAKENKRKICEKEQKAKKNVNVSIVLCLIK
jgi:hypothetical protein